MKKIFLTLLAIFMVTSFTISPSMSAATAEELPMELSDELIEVTNEHIELKGNSYKIVDHKELKDKISKQDLALVKEKLKETNQYLKTNNKLKKINNDTFIFEISDEEVQKQAEELGYDFDLNIEADQAYTEGQIGIASAWDYNGYNRMYLKWWGAEIWLSKTVVGNIAGGTVTAGSIFLGIVIPGIGWAIAIGVTTWIVGMYGSYNAKPIVAGVQWNSEIRYAYIQTP
ncbi:hypothetical protein [Jeotgalibacillus malaysiensis]|uniref:hypothetical protein n=1 Tax=Jeotgalibacillus malaysiensis TaxID=1508404 RepID=UPI00384F5053